MIPFAMPFSPLFYSVPSGGRPAHRPLDNYVADSAGRLCRPVRPPAPPSPAEDSAGGDEEEWKLHGGAHLWPTTEQYTHGAKLMSASSKFFLKNYVKIIETAPFPSYIQLLLHGFFSYGTI